MKDVTKKKLGQITKALKDTQAAFRFQVDLLAEEARSEILPFFMKHQYDFTSGHGTWLITRPDDYDPEGREVAVRDEDLPKNIQELLLLEVGHGDPLGVYIRDIKRGDR